MGFPPFSFLPDIRYCLPSKENEKWKCLPRLKICMIDFRKNGDELPRGIFFFRPYVFPPSHRIERQDLDLEIPNPLVHLRHVQKPAAADCVMRHRPLPHPVAHRVWRHLQVFPHLVRSGPSGRRKTSLNGSWRILMDAFMQSFGHFAAVPISARPRISIAILTNPTLLNTAESDAGVKQVLCVFSG